MDSICKHCNNSLNIKKATETNTLKISTPLELINASKSEEQQDYDIILDKTILEAYLLKKKINETEKKRIIDFYDTKFSQGKFISKFILKCNSACGSEYPLPPETIVYSRNFKKTQLYFDDDNIDLKLNDPTLPRTKDYICPNDECETNNKKFDQTNKEAVFYHAKDLPHSKYACCVCKKSWLV
jgi:hypothetical protein